MIGSNLPVVFVGLTILSALVLIIALVLVLIDGGQKPSRNDKAAGNDIFAEGASDDWEEPLSQKTVLRGEARSVDSESSISFSEVKKMVKRGQWREVLPVLLAVSGFLGLVLFGSFALFIALDNKLLGGLIASVAVFSVLRVLIRMAQA